MRGHRKIDRLCRTVVGASTAGGGPEPQFIVNWESDARAVAAALARCAGGDAVLPQLADGSPPYPGQMLLCCGTTSRPAVQAGETLRVVGLDGNGARARLRLERNAARAVLGAEPSVRVSAAQLAASFRPARVALLIDQTNCHHAGRPIYVALNRAGGVPSERRARCGGGPARG